MSPNDDAADTVNPYSAPQAAVEEPPPPAPIESGGFRSVTPLAKAIVGVMALFALVKAAEMANYAALVGLMKDVLGDRSFEPAAAAAVQQRETAGIWLTRALGLAAVVLFCLFMPRANRNGRAFSRGPMRFTPRWAAASFFIPLVNLFQPYEAVAEIWQTSDPDPSRPTLLVPVSNVVRWWWLMFLLANMTSTIVRVTTKNPTGAEEIITASYLIMGGEAMTIIAAVLAAMTVWAVAKRQDQRQRLHPAGTPLPQL